MEEITQNWKKLSLTEEEGRNLDLTKNKRASRFVLAAIFFMRHTVNIEAVARTFCPLWRTRREFEVNDAGNNIVLFDFELEADVEKVLLGEPWSYDRHLVVLERYDGSTLNFETAQSLGESIGVFMNPRDPSEMRGCNFMKVRVAVDISKPLCRGRRVTWDQDSDGWIAFKYERLSNLCYWCGLMSHDDKDCLIGIQSTIAPFRGSVIWGMA
ncbi:uncharacterized protein LOC142625033 [Castanea sativa]|uniref:uncharacterized protein LOC142625033 n=1 Tax=Castanea sativa TaxID=21020 RepID=UPI003F653C04